jgi:hypothetical protein
LALTNMADTEAAVTFTAYDINGRRISGVGITNPVIRLLAPGTHMATIDLQLFGNGLFDQRPIGWISIDSTVDALACFTLIFNANLSMMDGAPVAAPLAKRAVFTEINNDWFTDLHIVNANNGPANIILNLRREDGTIRASSHRYITPNGAIAESLAEIFDAASERSDYVEVLSDVSITPFQIMGKRPDYLAALNGLSEADSSKELYAPLYVIGGQMRSSVSIVNLDSFEGDISLVWYRDDGSYIRRRTMHIASHGKLDISSQALFMSPGVEISQGYLRITSNGPRVAGDIMFTDSQLSTFAAALPLASRLGRCMIFSQVASDQTNFTGLALLNPNNYPATTVVELYTAEGLLDARADIVVPAQQRISQVITQIFPSLRGQSRTSGYLRITSDQGIAAISIIGTTDMKTLAAVPSQIIR